MRDFTLPDLGEGVTEAEVDRWLVKEGDIIHEDAALVEVITDKASAEIPSPFAGLVAHIHVAEGQTARVGTTLVTIDDEVTTGRPQVPHDERGPSARGTSTEPAGEVSAPLPPMAPEERARAGGGQAMEVPATQATPPVRKLARSLQVNLIDVTGTGTGGRIERSDVERHAAATAPGPTTTGRRVPLRGVRKAIAARMQQARLVVPAVTHVEECDVTELEATRQMINARRADVPLTYLPFIVKASVAALKEHPALNSSLDEEASEIVLHSRYDVGIAVDTADGLLVPVVKGADTKSVADISVEIDRLAHAAREGSITTGEMSGATFTITSPGRFGGVMATPIVFHPQAAILGVHRASDRPVVRDGQIVVRRMMNLSVTFDHRILDGMTAARFALDIAHLIEHPGTLTLEDS